MEKIYAGFTEEGKKLLRRKHKDIAAGGRSAKYVSFIINGNRPVNSKLSREIYRVSYVCVKKKKDLEQGR